MSINTFKKISPRIMLIHLSETDSNIYLIDRNTIVDSGTGSNFVRLYDIFKRMDMDFDSVKKIINTHMHWDHIGGNGFFENAEIHIHEVDADVLESGDAEKSLAMHFNGNMHPFSVAKKLKEGDTAAGMKVIHTPGHTPGSICLWDREDKVLISGDTVFAEGVGRTDLVGGDEESLVKSMEKLKKLGVEILLPGHGDPVMKGAHKAMESLAEYADWN